MSLRMPGSSSSAESGPTRPPLAFDGASETSATSVGERLAGPRARLQRPRPSPSRPRRRPTFTPLPSARHGDQQLAQRDATAAVVNSFLCVVVVGLRLVSRRCPILPATSTCCTWLMIICFSRFLRRPVDGDAFLLERGVELLVGLELVLLADVLEHALELLVGHLVAELLAALEQQHLVDGVHQEVGRDFRDGLLQLLVGHLLRALAQRRDLARLELGLGDDLAVHLDQDLLEDLDRAGRGRGRCGRGRAAEPGRTRRRRPAARRAAAAGPAAPAARAASAGPAAGGAPAPRAARRRTRRRRTAKAVVRMAIPLFYVSLDACRPPPEPCVIWGQIRSDPAPDWVRPGLTVSGAGLRGGRRRVRRGRRRRGGFPWAV